MINLTVIKLSNILKFLASITIIFTVTFSIIFIFDHFFSTCFTSNSILETSIPGISELTTSSSNLLNESNYNESEDLSKTILKAELPILSSTKIASVDNNDNIENSVNDLNNNTSNQVSDTFDNLLTEVIPTNVPDKYTDEYQSVEVKNGTSYTLTSDILNPDTLEFSKENIIIFHTHTCESYTPSDNFPYTQTGNFRTTDLNFSVSHVGSDLANYLMAYGYNVIHDTTYHDYPSYNGSYGRSLTTVENILSDHPNTDIIIDIHRDAIGDSTYAPSVKIGNETVSQLMFVIGTDGGGLNHPNWQQNLKFAIKVQEKANEIFPGLFKPIMLRNSRYNQHLGSAACIIEVGATGNTLDESLGSMKYLSYILDKVIKE